MKPFSGQTFCCTGIPTAQRNSVADKIVELGGTHYTDLMSLVRHLVVGSKNTEKYRYLVRHRHDIVFVSAAAIDAVYKLRDERPKLVPMPVFGQVVACVARVESPGDEVAGRFFAEPFRKLANDALPKNVFSANDLIACMAQNGAQVSETLTPHCTVLVGTDTLGKRYTMAKEWGVPVVHPLWVYDSVLRGAALAVEDYELAQSNYSSGCFVWRKLNPRQAVKKSTKVWSLIMEPSGPSGPSGPSAVENWDEDVPEPATQPESSRLFAGLRFLPVGFPVAQQRILKKVVELHAGELVDPLDPACTHIVLLVRDGPQTLLMMLMLPSEARERVRSGKTRLVTDWFIERSVYYRKPCLDGWGRPLAGLVPAKRRFQVCVTGFTGIELLHVEKLVLLLNFEYCDVMNSTRQLLVLNISVMRDSLDKRLWATHTDIVKCPVYSTGDKLVSLTSAKNKVGAARKWGIPVVSLAYLWEMLAVSAGKALLRIPNVTDPRWLVAAPKLARAGSLHEYSLTDQGHDLGAVRLPSPRKSKDPKRYGRLQGRQTTSLQFEERKREQEFLESDDLTQVGYRDQELVMGSEELMRKLAPKRRRGEH